MVSQKVVIKNPAGLQVRPAGILCNEAMRFSSCITFQYQGNITNVKSILGLLGSSIKYGDEVELICDGEDEEVALQTILSVIENGLGE